MRLSCGSAASAFGLARARWSTTTTSSPSPAPRKWRHLERNRWALLIRTLAGTAFLALVMPALLLPSWR